MLLCLCRPEIFRIHQFQSVPRNNTNSKLFRRNSIHVMRCDDSMWPRISPTYATKYKRNFSARNWNVQFSENVYQCSAYGAIPDNFNSIIAFGHLNNSTEHENCSTSATALPYKILCADCGLSSYIQHSHHHHLHTMPLSWKQKKKIRSAPALTDNSLCQLGDFILKTFFFFFFLRSFFWAVR